MVDLVTTAQLEDILRTREGAAERAFQSVSPIGTHLGLVEMGTVFGVTARDNPAAFAERAIAYLTQFRLIEEFSGVLAAEMPQRPSEQELMNMRMEQKAGLRFLSYTFLARCQIWRDGMFCGSGVLVGPSLVLTCAHVLGPPPAPPVFPGLVVVLANRETIAVEQRPEYYSAPADADNSQRLARDDTAFADRHDVALLRLRFPAGEGIGVASVNGDDWKPTRNAAIKLLHFPQGQNGEVGECQLAAFTAPAARWRYTAPALSGSSGGGCFNVRGDLVGLHQGALQNTGGKRMVPLNTLRAHLSARVKDDMAPDYVWSIDGRLDGTLVIGRGELFMAFGKLAQPDSPLRALRIKRVDANAGQGGLGYSVELVRQLVARRPDGHRAIILSWPQALFDDFDLTASLVREARLAGLMGDFDDGAALGVAEGESARAAVIRGRVERVLGQLSARAGERGDILWIIIEHANAELGAHRLAVENIMSLVPRWPNLRVVLVGNEKVRLPMQQERRIVDAQQSDAPPPGTILVEHLGPIRREDVTRFIENAYRDIVEAPIDQSLAVLWTNNAVAGAAMEMNAYALAAVPGIVSRLRAQLRTIVRDDQQGAVA